MTSELSLLNAEHIGLNIQQQDVSMNRHVEKHMSYLFLDHMIYLLEMDMDTSLTLEISTTYIKH